MTNDLTTQQKGRCGELLVQYLLLKHGIESAHLTTDTGIDLVSYPRTASSGRVKPISIQVKTSSHRGVAEDRWIEWSVPSACPADFIAAVDLERNKAWFFSMANFKKVAKKAGTGYYRLWWSPPDYHSGRQARDESQFVKYEMERGISKVFRRILMVKTPS